jgi:hypothetical protein
MLRFALALFLATGFAQAAPLPPPRPLTAEMLIGRWEYKWGTLPVGWIEFRADGHYYSAHRQAEWPEFCGWWEIRGDVLTLREGRCPCREDLTATCCTSPYPVTISTAGFPVIAGTSYGTKVVLSNPVR